MEGLQSNQFIIRNIYSPSGAQGVVCIRRLQKGILIRNQFVSVSHSEVCTVMWPELWSEFSISFGSNFMHRRHCTVAKEKKKGRKKITFNYPVIHRNTQEVSKMVRKTYWVLCFCLQLSNLLFVSQSTVRSKGSHDQNIVISLKCEESQFVVIYEKCDNEATRATMNWISSEYCEKMACGLKCSHLQALKPVLLC